MLLEIGFLNKPFVQEIYEQASLGFSSDYNDYKAVTIYPNPVVDILRIKTPQLGLIYITNIFGKMVYKTKEI